MSKPLVLIYAGLQMLFLYVFCDVDHATIELTNLKNYSVEQFLYSFISF